MYRNKYKENLKANIYTLFWFAYRQLLYSFIIWE